MDHLFFARLRRVGATSLIVETTLLNLWWLGDQAHVSPRQKVP
jgi:hypothetical protein